MPINSGNTSTGRCLRQPDKHEIDHINLIKDDNRICNLREATRTGNVRNVGVKKHNKLGVKGVRRHLQSPSKFEASITVNGKRIYLGLYKSVEEASAAYAAASKRFHGEYGRLQ
jgi:hypothetical protein